ncbi:C6 zinc finger domain protein [Penicillium herquei]|nr:C6 zinc finger domain protein [Penicillium herquei]
MKPINCNDTYKAVTWFQLPNIPYQAILQRSESSNVYENNPYEDRANHVTKCWPVDQLYNSTTAAVDFEAHQFLSVMSTTISKRKRAMKACIPCHQRKRKCDTFYPCGMCTTYGYNCRYTDGIIDGIIGGGEPINQHPTKRVNLDGESRLASRAATDPTPGSRSHAERDCIDGNASSAKSLTVATGTSPGILEEQKLRYSGASAAMAFPHILGVALGSENPPKTRSFAYNFGIRPEEASNPHCFLGDIFLEEDLGLFSGSFFSVLGPIGDVIDPRIYAQRCRDYFNSTGSNAVAFAAVAAGVAALGSFLSPIRHPRESDLVQYAKAILDDPASMRLHGIDHIVAWGMRVFYLRATTRPSNAWIASCTQTHLCEAIGLHEEENIKKIASIAGSAAGQLPIGSGEFSGSRGQDIPCYPMNMIGRLHPFLVVTKEDIAFCFYRRLYQPKVYIPDAMIKLLIDIGNGAIQTADQQASQGRLFWNVIGSVFQYTCILLALDTPVASAHIGAAFKSLESLVKAADTGLTREALSTARHLLSLSMAKKSKELAKLEAVEASYEFFQTPATSQVNAAVPDMDWNVDWDQFFIEPYLSMLGPEVQL